MIIKEKKCSKCGEIKYLNKFYTSGYYKGKLKYHSGCKECLLKEKREKSLKPKIKKCKVCEKEFKPYTSLDKYCSAECRINNMKSKRKRNWNNSQIKKRSGKNNPAYRNGYYCKINKKTSVGLKKFQKNKEEIKQEMIDNVGFIYCEHCGVSNSIRFESHHIIFRSEKPNHKHLHDKINILHLCIDCHNKYHRNKGKRNKIVEERKLHKLFGKDILNK